MSVTLEYYDQNADAFYENTVSVDFSETQQRFLNKVTKGSRILDFGCGSGRDTKCFLDAGYQVDAMDGSLKMCELASAYTGISVQHKLFQELDVVDTYDAIWACSSILHLPMNDLKEVLRSMQCALKDGGLIYTSFKYGEFAGERNGRYFSDFTEDRFQLLIDEVENLTMEEAWITSDVRPGRGEERWLNLFLRKNVTP